MTEDERLEQLLRSSLPPVATTSLTGPSRDLWPQIVRRSRTRADWSWLDVTIAVGVAAMLLMFPEWLLLLAYHL